MVERESTTGDRAEGQDGNQASDPMLLMSSKPLHRFVQREPRSLGIVILIFGCAEVLMGFVLAGQSEALSDRIYITFWQGALFLVCGNLSIYSEIRPSKKMVTVCLAMYVVSLLGLVVSIINRIVLCKMLTLRHLWDYHNLDLMIAVECVLLTSSVCVAVLLIILSTVARLALKSTSTQVIVQHVLPPLSNTCSN
ncbi:B-lymphocyte antigen CD20-like [Gasterosteus aculeatus]